MCILPRSTTPSAARRDIYDALEISIGGYGESQQKTYNAATVASESGPTSLSLASFRSGNRSHFCLLMLTSSSAETTSTSEKRSGTRDESKEGRREKV